MSITDELRECIATAVWQYENDIKTAYIPKDRLTAIADRIDEAHKHAIGYVADYDPETMAENGWVKLPVDADGVPIHIGDVMEGVDKYDSLKNVMGKVITVSFESDGIVEVAVRAWSSDGKSWHRAYLDSDASVYRHYHEPTVEDVLREFAEKITDSQIPNVHPTYEEAIAEYAAKLRLAGEGE